MSISKRLLEQGGNLKRESSSLTRIPIDFKLSHPNTKERIMIHTDGCRKRDGSGGWSCIIDLKKELIVLGAYKVKTTNNIMELMGLVESMRFIQGMGMEHIRIISDSQYCVKGLNQWMHSWQRRGWTKGGGDIKNLEIWKELFKLKRETKAEAQWVRGHSGNAKNELCDKIANLVCYGQIAIAERFKSLNELRDFIEKYNP